MLHTPFSRASHRPALLPLVLRALPLALDIRSTTCAFGSEREGVSHGPQPSAHSLESLHRAEGLVVQGGGVCAEWKEAAVRELGKCSDKSQWQQVTPQPGDPGGD